MFTEWYWIIIGVVLLVSLPFLLIHVPWKKISLKGFKGYVSIIHCPKMEISDLDDWDNGPIELYYGLIKDEYKRYDNNEDEINLRSTSLLAVEGVVLALMVAFLNQISEATFVVLLLFVTSTVLLLVSLVFIVLAIKPQTRKVLDPHSHKECFDENGNGYRPFRKDPDGLKKAILHDLLVFTESLSEIYPKKVNRFACALYLFIIAMFSLALMVLVHVFV
jgi:hypothetical protein